MKVQSLTEEISNGEKERQSLLNQLYDLLKETKLPAAKDVIVEENNLDTAQSMVTLRGKGVGSSAFGLSKKPVRGTSWVHSDAANLAHGAVVRISLENAVKGPSFGQPLHEVEVTLHVKQVVASEKPKPQLAGDSPIPLRAGSVCLDDGNLGIFKNAHASPGAFLECPVKAPLQDICSKQHACQSQAIVNVIEDGCHDSSKRDRGLKPCVGLDRLFKSCPKIQKYFEEKSLDYLVYNRLFWTTLGIAEWNSNKTTLGSAQEHLDSTTLGIVEEIWIRLLQRLLKSI
jgi:hypothetical protein